MPSTTPRRLCALLLSVLALLPSALPAQAPGEPLNVMSFNIRYGSANDGENRWTARRGMLFDLLRREDADIIGLQEALAFQITEIVAARPAYAAVGVGRDDAAARGEFSAVLFRRDRFRVAEAGTFWFSETPAEPGSRSWGNRIPRICTWARLVDRDGQGFYVYNVHLDHESQPSRERSAQLLLERIQARAFPADPVVVTGDFNAGEKNPALATLFGPLVDTFRAVRPDDEQVGTFTGFTYGRIDGEKIDYVLVQPGTAVLDAGILRFSRRNRYPSDHFPVTARIRFTKR